VFDCPTPLFQDKPEARGRELKQLSTGGVPPFAPALPLNPWRSEKALRASRSASSAGNARGRPQAATPISKKGRGTSDNMTTSKPRASSATAAGVRLPSVPGAKHPRGGGHRPARQQAADGGGGVSACWPPAASAESLFELQQEVASRRTVFVSAQLQVQTAAKLLAGAESDIRQAAARRRGRAGESDTVVELGRTAAALDTWTYAIAPRCFSQHASCL
jgi:hypothetical protein